MWRRLRRGRDLVAGRFLVAKSAPLAPSGAAWTLIVCSAIVTAALLVWARNSSGEMLAPIFHLLFAVYDAQAAGWTLGVLGLALIMSTVLPGVPVLHWISDHMTWVLVATVVVLCIGSLAVYRDHRLSMDEYAVYFQSQIFAAGKLSGNFPTVMMDWLVPGPFQNAFLSVSKVTGNVASAYWPSFALLLTPFTALGIPWACNPVISALTLLVAHRLALRIYADEDAAAMVVLLTVASPVFFLDGISYYSMSAHLLANTLYALLLIDPTCRKAMLAGLVGSVALTLHNPVPHMLFAAPWIVWLFSRQRGVRLTAYLAAGYAPLCLILGVGWFLFTEHLRQGGVSVQPGGGTLANLSKLLSVFSFPSGGIVKARLIGVAKVWLWAVPGLMILACMGAWKNWSHPALRMLACSALLTLLGYFMVPLDQGHGWGYRYFHSAWIALPILASGAVVPTAIGRRGTYFEDQSSRAFIVTSAALMLAIAIPLRAIQVRNFMIWDVSQVPVFPGKGRQVVMINRANSFYGADLVQNDPWLRGRTIRMLSHGEDADARMMAQQFPRFHRVTTGPHGTVWSDGGLSRSSVLPDERP